MFIIGILLRILVKANFDWLDEVRNIIGAMYSNLKTEAMN
jgi:hypothetical protein